MLQIVLGVRARRGGWRVLSPRWLRIAATAGWTWGCFTALNYLMVGSGTDSAISGGLFAVFFTGVMMWLLDPADPDRPRRPGPAPPPRGREHPRPLTAAGVRAARL